MKSQLKVEIAKCLVINIIVILTLFILLKLNLISKIFFSGKWRKNVVYYRTTLSGGLVVELADLNLFGFPVKVVCRDIKIINRKLNNFRNIMSIYYLFLSAFVLFSNLQFFCFTHSNYIHFSCSIYYIFSCKPSLCL